MIELHEIKIRIQELQEKRRKISFTDEIPFASFKEDCRLIDIELADLEDRKRRLESNIEQDTSVQNQFQNPPENMDARLKAADEEACREFNKKLHQIPVNNLKEGVWQMRLLLDEWEMEQQSLVLSADCWDRVQAKVDILKNFVRLVDECNGRWRQAEIGLLEYQLNGPYAPEQAGKTVDQYKAVLESAMSVLVTPEDENDVVHYLVRQLIFQLQKELHNKWRKARQYLKTLAENRTNAAQMAEAVTILKGCVEDSSKEIPYVVFYEQFEGDEKGVLPANEALIIAKERLLKTYKKETEGILEKAEDLLKKDHKPYEARRTLESLARYQAYIGNDLLSAIGPDRIEKLEEDIDNQLLAYKNADEFITYALERVDENPIEALDYWDKARKQYIWLVHGEKDKKEEIDRGCDEWIKKHFEKANSVSSNQSIQFHLDAVAKLLEKAPNLKAKYWDKYNGLLHKDPDEEE